MMKKTSTMSTKTTNLIEWCMLLVIEINLILCEQFGMVNGEIYHVPYRLCKTEKNHFSYRILC